MHIDIQLLKTILESAVFLSAITYLFQKHVLEPRQEIQTLISEIDSDLIYYAEIWANPGDNRTAETIEAKNAFRKHSAVLRAKVRGLGFRRCVTLVRLPSLEALTNAATALVRMSNGTYTAAGETKGEVAARNRTDEAVIRKLLNIVE